MVTTLNSLKSFTTALGYGPNDGTIFFRLITAKNFDISNDAHVKLLPGLTYIREGKLVERKTNLSWNLRTGIVYGYGSQVKSHDIISYLQSQSDLGMGIYIVVNPGGQKILDITEARVIYYENDEHSIPDQIAKFTELNDRWGGGFAVKTRNSVHSYFRLESPVTPTEFTEVQKRIIAYIPGSDKCIHDPSRVMRVPGFDHIQIDSNEVIRTPIEMIHDWGGTYTNWQQINSDLPQLPKTKTDNKSKVTLESTIKNPMTTPNPDNYPSLTAFLSIQNREFIKHGAELGFRNTAAKTLASDLIGTARQLVEMGIPTSDNANDLYLQYCEKCDTAKPGELEGIWENTLEENPTACLDTEKLITNNKAYYARTFKDGISLNSDRNNSFNQFSAYNNYPSILAQELEYLDASNVIIPTHKQNTAIQLWAKIRDRYPSDVIKSIEANTHRLGVPAYVYAMAYDCVVSGMCNGKYSVRLDDTWTEPLNVFLTIVGVQGVNKSHIIKWLTSFLAEKNAEYRADNSAAKKQYKTDYNEYLLRLKQDPTDSENIEPTEPELKYASHGKKTHAKFIASLGTQKEHFNSASNLVVTDEMTYLFGGDEKTGVNTSELSVYLTGFSGGELTSDTKCDGVQGVSKTMFSVLTTTQPKTIVSLVKKLSDGNGFIERFLTPIINDSDTKPYDWKAKSNPSRPIGAHLEDLYYKFDALDPNHEIPLSDSGTDAMQRVEAWVYELKSLRAKPKSYIIRLAGLYAVYEDYKNPIIHSEHILAAWEVMKMDEANKVQLGITVEPQGIGEEVLTKAIDILLTKGMLSAGKLGGQMHALRETKIPERQLVIDKVAKIMGNKARTEVSANGKSVLVLNVDYVPTIEVTTTQVVTAPTQYIDETSAEVDETPIDTVQLKGSQILPTTEDPTLEAQLTQACVEQSIEQTQPEPLTLDDTDTIYISYENLTETQQLKANPNNIYQITRHFSKGILIKLNDDTAVLIPTSLLEKQIQDEQENYSEATE